LDTKCYPKFRYSHENLVYRMIVRKDEDELDILG